MKNNYVKENINNIINSNNIDVLKNMQDNSICSIITDVPYGLQDIDALKLIKENANNTRGFMNATWDCLPTIDMLKEFFRVLKTGGFFITTFTPRQDLQTIFCYRLLEAGFDINFSPLYYCFASGFPKPCDYSKMAQKSSGIEPKVIGTKKQNGAKFNHIAEAIDNGGFNDKDRVSYNITEPTTDEAKYLKGLKSLQLKPAVEPIIIAQKPHNKAKYKQAIDWYQERRDLLDKGITEEDLAFYTTNSSGGVNIHNAKIPADEGHHDSKGRFPANILVADNCLDVGRETKSIATKQSDNRANKNNSIFIDGVRNNINSHSDHGDLSRYFSLDAWTKKHHPELYKMAEKTLRLEKDAEKISPCLFLTKPTRAEKDAGLENSELQQTENEQRDEGQAGFDNPFKNRPRMVYNNHPTGKPLALFNYLISLFTKENDIILDPFCGSGTTCISATLTKRKYIGIDITENYCKIARERIKFWQKEIKTKQSNELF